MSPTLHHECIRTPVTALAAVGPLVLAAEGPRVLFYSQDSSQFTFLTSRDIFNDQAIHGIAVLSGTLGHVIFAIWGGPLVRFLLIKDVGYHHTSIGFAILTDNLHPSSVSRLPDWILDLSFAPTDNQDHEGHTILTCAAVTAHNALVEITIQWPGVGQEPNDTVSSERLAPQISELTSSSRSILYSAHLLWKSSDHILIAAGTAFGEIIYWSWTRNHTEGSYSCLHRVFLGHEGSIFGVRISSELSIAGQSKRYLASCSDDRTIRVWDLSDIETRTGTKDIKSDPSRASRTRHTGFSNASFDVESPDSRCLAIGWGHYSRIWAVQFLESQLSDISVTLLSSGEDATSRTWQFSPGKETAPFDRGVPISLAQTSMAAYHSGKNIWSTTLFGSVPGSQQIICGAADSKITAHALPTCQAENGGSGLASNEYTVEDILAMSGSDPSLNIPPRTAPAPKSAKQGHSFRGYAFVDDESFLLITNAGKVLLETLKSEVEADGAPTISQSKLIDQLDELSNYSVCAADSTLGLGFIAGSRGGIYMYQKGSTELLKLHAVQGKVGGLFIGQQLDSTDTGQITLLVTLMGQKMAKLLYLDVCKESKPSVLKNIDIMISESSTGTTITSVVYIPAGADEDHLILGFRGGSVAAYSLANDSATDANKQVTASFVEKAHGKEAVTSLLWHPSSSPSRGHLISAGRDGCCAVHSIDFPTSTISLSHNLPLAVGPNLEGLYFHHNHLIMYGFSGTKFIVYDITVEEEIMSVETGGSHRSWSFRPSTPPGGGGTLVWTRAATMHIYTQTGSNHTVIRSGGHGREIKDVAVTHTDADDNDFRTLIATGAEDTDIRIFEYVGNDYVCRRTLRKHNTGIQHLQWSSDNHYLFSSGGCEEFFVWRIRSLPQFMGIGIVCEAICPPQSELPDVRITSFDVGRPSNRGSGFVIAMVFSDSMIRVYHYDPGAMGERWNMLAKGAYFTSCLTQCVFLSPSSIFTAGTDGHAVLWPLQEAIQDEAFSTQSLTWHSPARIHQNTSKAISTHSLDNGSTLLVSGGDDGSLAFLLASQMEESYTHSPIVVVRAHASAITACTILWQQQDHICVLTSGNDQWVRLWDVKLTSSAVPTTKKPDGSLDPLTIKRATRIKTNVADVSSMAIIETDPTRTRAKVMICGVGMDVLRLEWQAVD